MSCIIGSCAFPNNVFKTDALALEIKKCGTSYKICNIQSCTTHIKLTSSLRKNVGILSSSSLQVIFFSAVGSDDKSALRRLIKVYDDTRPYLSSAASIAFVLMYETSMPTTQFQSIVKIYEEHKRSFCHAAHPLKQSLITKGKGCLDCVELTI